MQDPVEPNYTIEKSLAIIYNGISHRRSFKHYTFY